MEPTPLSNRLFEYIETTKGWFFTQDVVKTLNLVEAKDKVNIRVQLNKMADKGTVLERHPQTDGRWRRIDTTAPAMMDFANIDTSKTVECYLPFHLEDFFKVYPSNVFIYSGVSNYGKTELLLMTAFLNPQHPSVFFNTDADAEEMLERIQLYQPYSAWATKFPRKMTSEEIPALVARHYSNDFVFIDYLKVTKEYYEISALIEQVGQALNKGVAFIGLQKNKGVDWARGGQQTLDLSRLYISLDPGPADVDREHNRNYPTTEMKITKMKMLKNPKYYNPNDWKFIYRVIHHVGEMPTFKMIYEPPEYVEFNNRRKAVERIKLQEK
jgi:hypothetical protein